MATPTGNRLLTTEVERTQAQSVLDTLEGPPGFLAVGRDDRPAQPLPRELGLLLQQLLSGVVDGGSITISAIPEEVTPATAASLLGLSRPTVMKLIADGTLPAHKVGSHHRVKSRDVLAQRRARRDRERAAFEARRELEDDVM